jgi:hypothetical protein
LKRLAGIASLALMLKSFHIAQAMILHQRTGRNGALVAATFLRKKQAGFSTAVGTEGSFGLDLKIGLPHMPRRVTAIESW